MKPKWVATQNARKFKAVFQFVKKSSTVFLMSLLLLINSCGKSDDLETIVNELPIGNESPPDNQSPPDYQPPTDNQSPTDEGSLIIYTDIEPDFTSQNLNDFYNLDLNKDQIIDFTVSSDFDSWEEWIGIASNPIAINGIFSVAPWYSNPIPLNSGEKIFNLEGYRNGEFYETWGIFTVGDCFGGEQGCFYDWKNKVDKYLGLRFIINGQTHYGWVQMDVTSVTQWVIKDYAYNAKPNKPILAGQKV